MSSLRFLYMILLLAARCSKRDVCSARPRPLVVQVTFWTIEKAEEEARRRVRLVMLGTVHGTLKVKRCILIIKGTTNTQRVVIMIKYHQFHPIVVKGIMIMWINDLSREKRQSRIYG